MKDLKFNISCLKAQDCHVVMTQLLPVAIRGVLLEKVRELIIKFCSFFNAISHKVIDPMELKKLQDDLIHIMSRLEMHLPPTFFYMSVHLVVHLIRQIKLLGPIFLHQMFLFERLMSVLRKYVRNRYRPKGCMVEGWPTEEALESYIQYFGHTGLDVPVSRHKGRLQGKGIIGEKRVRACGYSVVMHAHFTVLQQAQVVLPYVKKHKEELAATNILGPRHGSTSNIEKSLPNCYNNITWRLHSVTLTLMHWPWDQMIQW